jgi:hypothetical protein
VMASYVYHADHGEWHALANLFTPDANFTAYGPKGELYLDLTGPAEIEDTITRSVGNSQAIHHLFSFTAEVDTPASASLVVNMEDLITPAEEAESDSAVQLGDVRFRSVHGYGHYRCRFEKIGDDWKIRRLVQTRLRMDFTS